MEQYFKKIAFYQSNIDVYNKELQDIQLELLKLREDSSKFFYEEIKENEILSLYTQDKNENALKKIISLVILFLYLIATTILFFYTTRLVELVNIMYCAVKGLVGFSFISGISFIFYQLCMFFIKNYFSIIREKNKEKIEEQRKKIEDISKKSREIDKCKSVLIQRKYSIEQRIKEEREKITKINDILLEELAPLLDDLIEKELKSDNLEIKEVMDNISRKLINDKSFLY